LESSCRVPVLHIQEAIDVPRFLGGGQLGLHVLYAIVLDVI
jgi:hypothetical protein